MKAPASFSRRWRVAPGTSRRGPWPVLRHTQCGTGFLADPDFRHRAAEATGIAEPALEALAVTDPHSTVKADVERLLTSPRLSPKVRVSGHVYDIDTGRVTTVLDAQFPNGR